MFFLNDIIPNTFRSSRPIVAIVFKIILQMKLSSIDSKSKRNVTKKTPPSPSRRHADNVLVLARSAIPGCICPRTGHPDGRYVRYIYWLKAPRCNLKFVITSSGNSDKYVSKTVHHLIMKHSPEKPQQKS